MAQNMSNYDAVLKEFVEGAVRETVNNEVPLLKMLEESDREWSGRYVRYPFRTSRNSGVGSRSDGGTLPTAGQQGYTNSQVSASYLYARFEISGPTIRSGKHAFADALSSEMNHLVGDLKNELGRQTWGTGDGRLAEIAASSTAATGSVVVTLSNRFAQPGEPGARYISVGMQTEGGTIAVTTNAWSSQTISAVTVSTNPATTTDTITLGDSACAFSGTNHYVFVEDAGGVGVEMNGLLGLIDDVSAPNWWGTGFISSVQGINRSTVGAFNAIVMGNSGTERFVTSNLMQQAFDKIQIQSGEKPDIIMGHHDTVRAFLDHVSADRRYMSKNFDAGMSDLSYNGVDIVADRQAPYNCLVVFKRSVIRKFTLLPVGFADDDGAILSRVANQDSYEGYLRHYGNLGIDGNPKALLRIQDIKVDL